MYYKLVFGIFLFPFVIITNKVSGELCDKTKITVLWPNFTKQCLPCATCRRGWGATYSCGDVINAPLRTPNITCVKCKRRHTYSAVRSSDRCRKCTTCQLNRKIIKKCTRSADTRCGGCKAGYYEFQDPHFSSCEKCSPCCGDANDERIEECARQGLPRNRQCRFRQDRNCSLHLNPRSSQRVPVTKTTMTDQLDLKPITSTVSMKPTRDQKSTTFPVTMKPSEDQKITTSTDTMKLDLKSSTLKIKAEAANSHIVHIDYSVDSTISSGLYIFLPLLIIALVIIGVVMYKRKQRAKQTEDRNTSVERNSLTSEEGSTGVDCEQGGQGPSKDDRQSNNDLKEKENESARRSAQDAVSSCPLKKLVNDPEYDEICGLLNTKLHPHMVKHYNSISHALGVTDGDIIKELMKDEKGAAQALFDYIVATKIQSVTLENIACVLDHLKGRAPAAKMLRDADNRLKQQEA